MGENIDIKALRARFNNQSSTSQTSSRDSGSPKSPRPGFGRASLPMTENNMAHHRVSPTAPFLPMAGVGLVRFPRAEPLGTPRPVFSPRMPPNPGLRPGIQGTDTYRVRPTGEMQQNIMQRQQRPPVPRPLAASALAPAPAPGPGPALVPVPVPVPVPAPATTSTPLPLQQQPRQRSTGDVTPLRRPLPPEGPLPLKPKRPPNVNLEPYVRFRRGPALPEPRKRNTGSPATTGRKMSLPVVVSPPKLPQRSIKPSMLPRQVASIDIDDFQDTYDDIANTEKNESWSDGMEEVNEEVYESIQEDQIVEAPENVEKKYKKDVKRHQEQERKDQMERQKKENDLKKKFQLQGEVEVLHTARVRHDWYGGGKLDLSVQQDERVEILRVKNNPEGKWLARSLDGNYGYISNTCVDIDYEEVKRKFLMSRKIDTSPLPPPPPDPPQMLNMESFNKTSLLEDDDDYDDVQPLNEDFPLPPPPESCIDPNVMKELRKRFKYEGPLTALHTMMVDPNSSIKKPSAKDLHVTNGELVDVIQLTSSKKALCRNKYGKYGYVLRTLLLPMEGDIYDDVDYSGDIYDNDSPHTDY